MIYSQSWQEGKHSQRLDLSQAYLQLPLDEEIGKSMLSLTYKKACYGYGISSAPGIFQKYMENVLQGIPNVIVFLDDVLITGKTESDHLRNLSKVLTKLEKAGLRARKSKYKFMAKPMVFLGHTYDQ